MRKKITKESEKLLLDVGNKSNGTSWSQGIAAFEGRGRHRSDMEKRWSEEEIIRRFPFTKFMVTRNLEILNLISSLLSKWLWG